MNRVGRYLSPEPMLQEPGFAAYRATQGLNTPAYAYANNNPLSRTDSTGLFDTPSSPSSLCAKWDDALPIARKMAGCDEAYSCDLANPCQKAIRGCSTGCDICKALMPGSGPSAEFGELPGANPSHKADTWPLWYSMPNRPRYNTKFDVRYSCADAHLLAQVMIHEASHACTQLGGANGTFDSYDLWKRGKPGCYSDFIAPFKPGTVCGY